MKKLLFISALLAANNILSAQQINLASGTTGTVTGVAQSFNETRGVDVQVIGPTAINVVSMKLSGFFCGFGGQAYVDARIYNSTTAALLAGANDTVTGISGGSITVPIAYTLVPGITYRIAFYASGPNPPTHNSGYMFQPTAFPYTESTGMLSISHAYAYPADTIPHNNNIYVPQITLNTSSVGIREIGLDNAALIYPNPFNTHTTLEFSNEANKNCTLFMYDEQGKCVQTKANITANKVDVERGNLPNGIYFYQVVTDNKVINTGKLIIE